MSLKTTLPGAVAVGSLSHNAIFSLQIFLALNKNIAARKDFFSLQDPWALLNHSPCCNSKPMVRPLSSFLLVNSHKVSRKLNCFTQSHQTISRLPRALISEVGAESHCLHYWLEMLSQGNHWIKESGHDTHL